MTSLQAEITINAPPQVVRSTLLDFQSHSQWNPFFVQFKQIGDGELGPGTSLEIDMKLKGEKYTTKMKPVVQENTPEVFRWKGRLGFDSIFSGEHYFQFHLAQDGKATRLVQGENFGGILVPVFSWIGIMDKTRASFDDLNTALKAEAEKRAK